MDEGRPKHYTEAITWLAKVRGAYLAEGREEEWRVYPDELIDRHQRRYRLRPGALLTARRRSSDTS